MAKLSKLELQVMNALWTLGRASVREIQETFAEKVRPAYTTVQTMVYRLEGKQAVRRVKKMGWIHWAGEAIFISKAVRGERVGLAETEHGDWTVRVMHLELGRIDRTTRRFTPTWHKRGRR